MEDSTWNYDWHACIIWRSGHFAGPDNGSKSLVLGDHSMVCWISDLDSKGLNASRIKEAYGSIYVTASMDDFLSYILRIGSYK